jgi:DNA-directed RNA polymerase specialized sigma24 family protein
VKEALEALPDRAALAQVKLTSLPYLGREGGDRARELDELLRDAARELAGSSDFRDAQSGLLLVDYYVKRNGTHEQIAERLHLSRPAYYRRLQRGCELLAERLESLAAFTETV